MAKGIIEKTKSVGKPPIARKSLRYQILLRRKIRSHLVCLRHYAVKQHHVCILLDDRGVMNRPSGDQET